MENTYDWPFMTFVHILPRVMFATSQIPDSEAPLVFLGLMNPIRIFRSNPQPYHRRCRICLCLEVEACPHCSVEHRKEAAKMESPAFSTSFSGLALKQNVSAPSVSRTRAAMGDNLAPSIHIRDTKWDGTSSISVAMKSIEASEAAAVGVAGSAALGATMRRRKPPATALPGGAPATPPAGVAPKDFYFPPSTRNEAPVISFPTSDSLSVSFEKVNPVVSGASANSADSIAFWKKKEYKYSAPDAPEVVPGAEVISTAKFEAYFPTK